MIISFIMPFSLASCGLKSSKTTTDTPSTIPSKDKITVAAFGVPTIAISIIGAIITVATIIWSLLSSKRKH